MTKAKQQGKWHRRVHLGLAFVWVGLIVPTLLWWRESILWVAFMSLYANVAGHLAAYEGARPNDED